MLFDMASSLSAILGNQGQEITQAILRRLVIVISQITLRELFHASFHMVLVVWRQISR